MMSKKIDAKMNLPEMEEKILKHWDENSIFQKTLDANKDKPIYSFYDGPPFATGAPHYGHIVASTIKDVVPRYWSMQGYNVPRVWGWDCHGLPIENIGEKELGLKTKKDIERVGIAKFNEFCRSQVLKYTNEWKVVIRRMGRWVDMDNAYKTMDKDYMESVWWVFKQLWDKGLIYEDYRSMHICPRCETTLSQSEVAEGYKSIKDLSAIIKFHLLPGQKWANGKYETKDSVYILAWTTTPWTLLGNVALAVGEQIKYTAFRINNIPELLIIASDRLNEVSMGHEIEIVHNDILGSDLIGLEYEPLFDNMFYADIVNKKNGWKVVVADFVSTEEGTGVVHIAPAFGENDLLLGRAKDLPFVQHVGMDGIVKAGYGEFAGMNVKPSGDHFKTDVEVIKYLDKNNLLFHKEKYQHSYPHCWRCDTPLINYATNSWFVSVTKIKDRAIELAKEINWSPGHIKNGRFGKWLMGARDWSISRQRFWASVIPIWRCKCGEIVVIGSVAELEKLSGQKIDDLHKHIIDDVVFACQKCDGEMKRIPDVLDTWFDSGSMPYAQCHYPFENQDVFDKSSPAEFIGEGVDQTRAWFYYLHTISVGIDDKLAYKNVIANGMILAEDGKKMSKRLQNYPDPKVIFDKYGADVLRYYLLSSPVIAAETLNFSEKELSELSRGMFRMLWNSYYFFTLYAEIEGWSGDWKQYNGSNNILDRWIVSELESLTSGVISNMKCYDLLRASRIFQNFIEEMSNWYIRRSRKRFWKSEDDSDKESAFVTLNYVLCKLSVLFAPFCPFISEEIYTNLSDSESVHLEAYVSVNDGYIDSQLAQTMVQCRQIIEIALALRDEKQIKVRQPLSTLEYTGKSLEPDLESIIAEEVNVKNVKQVSKLSLMCANSDKTVAIDINISEELMAEGISRDFIRVVQVLRKKSSLLITDRIILYYFSDDGSLMNIIAKRSDEIIKETMATDIVEGKRKLSIDVNEKINGADIWVGIEINKT